MCKSHFIRILQNPVKQIIVLLILLIPAVEVAQLYIQLKDFGDLRRAVYTLFYLSGAGRGHMFQVLGLWLLPLYLLIVVGDDSCVDEKTGYKYALLCRGGKKTYLKEKWFCSFIISSALMFISLLINVILVYVVFASRCSDEYLDEYMSWTTFPSFNMSHPMLSYFLYMITASLISGLLGCFSSMVSTTFRDRKYVYAIVFLIWLIFIVADDSIMLVFQPYNEYSVDVLARTMLKFLLVCFMGVLGAAIYEKVRSCE